MAAFLRKYAVWLCLAALSPDPIFAQDDSLPPPPLTLEEKQHLSSQASLLVRDFEFTGQTVFSRAQLLDAPVITHVERGQLIVDKRVSEYRNRELSLEDLEQVRIGITQLYVDHGYINSGAIIPEQDGWGGVIRFQIIEGRLTQINITTTGRLPSGYFRKRIAPGGKTPLNLKELHDRLEIVRQNPNVERLNAGLRPGIEPGQSTLDVLVHQKNTWQLSLSLNNYRSPSIGAERFVLDASTQNLLGFGDAASLRYGLTTGGWNDMEFDSPGDPQDFSVNYSLPLSASDTTLSFTIDKSDDAVIQSTFDELDISSEEMSYSLTLRQPIYRTPRTEVALFVTGALRSAKTFLMDEPYAFPPDPASETNVTLIQIGQEFWTHSTRDALALRSVFTIGLNAFGATRSDSADGQFVAWLGQGQYLRKLNESDLKLLCRFGAQLASDSLLSMEQFALGGVNTVRGYPENQLVRDNALTSSIELHIPLIRRGSDESILELVPFFDAGYAWNHIGDPESELISSAGVGLLFHPNQHINAEVYWGHPFKSFDSDDNDLQDMGIHFNVTISAF